MAWWNWRRKRPKHADRVASLFDEVRGFTPEGQAPWLARLQQDAKKKGADWKAELRGYLQGLAAKGAIEPAKTLELEAAIKGCDDRADEFEKLIAVAVWGSCLAAQSLLWWSSAASWTAWAVPVGVGLGIAAWWAAERQWVPRRSRIARAVWVVCFASAAGGFTFVLSLFVTAAGQKLALQAFDADRAALTAEPAEFPLVRDFAMAHYGVDLELGQADDGWVRTGLNVPWMTPAAMWVGPGYCELNMSRTSVLSQRPRAPGIKPALWLQGVMMHELGHCLDNLRDLPSFSDRTVHTHSVAPVDADKVKDLTTFLASYASPATKLWREAGADIFAVGFWRLTASADAPALAAHLRESRGDSAAQKDPSHATACWIDQAMQAEPPSSAEGLRDWADRVRSTAQCPLGS